MTNVRLRLEPDALQVSPRAASSIKGSATRGIPTAVEDLEPVDVVVVGPWRSTAAARASARAGA